MSCKIYHVLRKFVPPSKKSESFQMLGNYPEQISKVPDSFIVLDIPRDLKYSGKCVKDGFVFIIRVVIPMLGLLYGKVLREILGQGLSNTSELLFSNVCIPRRNLMLHCQVCKIGPKVVILSCPDLLLTE